MPHPNALRITQGQRHEVDFFFEDETLAYDLTGWDIRFQVKDRNSGRVLYTMPSENITVTGTTFKAVITALDSEEWTFTRARFSVWIADPNGPPTDPRRYRVNTGYLIVDDD